MAQPVNPRRYGARTWFDAMSHRYSVLDPPQAAAVGAYLNYKLARPEVTDRDRQAIGEAMRNYWNPKAAP